VDRASGIISAGILPLNMVEQARKTCTWSTGIGILVNLLPRAVAQINP
jgi:hypothetical protein